MDFNQLAKKIVDQLTADPKPAPPEKNAAAVALGRLGASKGGKARAEKLSPEQRQKIASNAANARWEKKKIKQS